MESLRRNISSNMVEFKNTTIHSDISITSDLKEESRVLVLLSTYNGEKYLKSQIDSIFAQQKDGINISILVRDDGSSDDTLMILKQYINNGADLNIIAGHNVGPSQSFRLLIDLCDKNYDFYAFADQDDIWDENKISTAVSHIKKVKENVPVLWYCALSYLVNDKAQGYFFCPEARANNIEVVLDTFSTTNGCTMVFNKNLMNILKNAPSGEIDMHDSWTNAICLAYNGKIIATPEVLVLYRIHENQVLGNQKSSFLKNLKRAIYPARKRHKTIITLCRTNCPNEEFKKYMTLLANYKKNRFRIMFRKKPVGMKGIEFIKFIIQILLNRY